VSDTRRRNSNNTTTTIRDEEERFIRKAMLNITRELYSGITIEEDNDELARGISTPLGPSGPKVLV